MDDIVAIVVSMLLSGLLATLVTIIYQKRAFDHAAKLKVFETTMSYRYRFFSEESVKALNSIDVIFHDNDSVRKAWRSFIDETEKTPSNGVSIDDKYIKVLEEMAKAVGYKNIKWDDLKKHYYPTGLSDQIRDDEMLKKVQIDSALKSLSETNEQKNVPQHNQLNENITVGTF